MSRRNTKQQVMVTSTSEESIWEFMKLFSDKKSKSSVHNTSANTAVSNNGKIRSDSSIVRFIDAGEIQDQMSSKFQLTASLQSTANLSNACTYPAQKFHKARKNDYICIQLVDLSNTVAKNKEIELLPKGYEQLADIYKRRIASYKENAVRNGSTSEDILVQPPLQFLVVGLTNGTMPPKEELKEMERGFMAAKKEHESEYLNEKTSDKGIVRNQCPIELFKTHYMLLNLKDAKLGLEELTKKLVELKKTKIKVQQERPPGGCCILQ